MSRRLSGIFAVGMAVGLAGFPARAASQSPLPVAIEVRTDAAFPRGGAFEDHADAAVGLGINAAIQLVPNYAVYAAYRSTAFELNVVDSARATDSGFAVGLTRAFPIAGSGVAPWVGTGLLIHTLRVDGAPTAAGESRLGYEVGGGVAVAIAPRVRVTPGIGFRRYEAPFLTNPRERISYFSAGVGVNMEF